MSILCRRHVNSHLMDNPQFADTLSQGFIEMKIESLFRATLRRFRANKSVNIEFANEYLARMQKSITGILTLFLVDDLLEALNLDATRAVFGAESGFKTDDVNDSETIRAMFLLAENVKLLDTVLDKTLHWYLRHARTLPMSQGTTWDVWRHLNAAEYIQRYKQMYEGFPGQVRSPYRNTLLQLPPGLNSDPDRAASVIVLEDQEEKKSRSRHRSKRRRSHHRSHERRRNKSQSNVVVAESCSRNQFHHRDGRASTSCDPLTRYSRPMRELRLVRKCPQSRERVC